VNPANATTTEATLQAVREAAPAMGLQIQIVNASTIAEINAAFASLVRERADALLVTGDGLFSSRRVQLATLAAREQIPMANTARDYPAVGSLMSYGTNQVDAWRQTGIYVRRILKGEKPSDLPVQQAVKFELVINLGTATLLGLTVPPTLLSVADEVIE
jgi:putative ABC transport system substrate-binding protein